MTRAEIEAVIEAIYAIVDEEFASREEDSEGYRVSTIRERRRREAAEAALRSLAEDLRHNLST